MSGVDNGSFLTSAEAIMRNNDCESVAEEKRKEEKPELPRKVKARRLCKHLVCQKCVVLKGYCMQHARDMVDEDVVDDYLRRQRENATRCKYDGCTKVPYYRKHCWIHGCLVLGKEVMEEKRIRNRSTCKFPDCSKVMVLKGYCTQHARDMGDEAVVDDYLRKQRENATRCKYDGCTKVAYYRQYCWSHGCLVLGKEVMEEKRIGKRSTCKFPDCSKVMALKGYCTQHARDMVDKDVVDDYLRRQRENATRCKYDGCTKLTYYRQHCWIHGCLLFGKAVMEEKRIGKRSTCKFPDCSKVMALKGYCTQHARDMVDKDVVDDHVRKQRA